MDRSPLQQSARSLNCFVHCITCVMAIFVLDLTDGLSWIDVPDKHTNVKYGNSFTMNWHYKLDGNEIFLFSDIESFEDFKPLTSIGSRTKGDAYEKYEKQDHSFSIFGKNNVTLVVRNAEVGHNITYCCEVKWRSVDGINKTSSCSKVFVYDLPRIIQHTPQLSCRQGDSINLKCNATGIPKPHIEWTHDKTHSLVIDKASDIEVNITGKRSEGRYCCGAYNGFGEEKACTAVNVTEYQPVNTVILVNWTNKDDDTLLIHVMCKAVASPSSNLFIIEINDKKYNSSYGSKTIEVLASRKLKTTKIAVSCIPWNIYGQGPFKKVIIPLYAPPRFAVSLRTKYNMTVNAITLKCEAFGTPVPRITWTSGDTGDIIGEGKFYQIPYVNCDTKTLTFYCHASNVMGSISSPLIHVEVMTRRSNCSTGDDNLDQSNSYSDKRIIAITISCASVMCILILILITRQLYRWWKIPKPPKDLEVTDNAEDPYQEPIDFVMADESRSLARNNTTSTDEGYASVEECRLSAARMKPAQKFRNPSTGSLNNSHLEEKERIYESLVPLGL